MRAKSLLRPEFLRENAASEIAEAAVVLPLLFMFLFSIYWFGRAFSIYATINHAARQGARMAAVPGCANCNPGNTWPGSSFPGDGIVATAVDNILLAAHVDPNKAQPLAPNPAPPGCPGAVPAGACATASGGGFTICRNVQLNAGRGSPPVCGVIVSFQYPYQFMLPFTSLNNERILLKAEGQMRGED
jgi:hypothetical protein